MLSVALLLPADSAFAHDPGMSSLAVVRTNAGVFCRAIVSNRELPPHRNSCDGDAVFRLRTDGHALALTTRCHAYDAEHTAFEGSIEVVWSSARELSLEFQLLEQLPRGHRSVVRQLDESGRVRSHGVLAREAPRWLLMAPTQLPWRELASRARFEPGRLALLSAFALLLLAAGWRWRRARVRRAAARA